MNTTLLKYTLIAIACFIVGLLLPSPLKESRPKSDNGLTQVRNSRISDQREKTYSRKITSRSQSNRQHPQSPSTLNLRTEVIEALIKAKGMERMLPKMGLNEEQVKAVIEIKAASLQGMKNLEVKHAKLESDEEGDYYTLNAFPEDHDDWLAEMAQQLQDLVGDDRAVVISRIIAKSYNKESTGLFRREIRSLKPKTPEGDVKIRESFFNKDGELFDHDYKIYRGVHEDRWEHLFKPG